MSESPIWSFSDLVLASQQDPAAFKAVGPLERFQAIQRFCQEQRSRIHQRHVAGASGRYVLGQLTAVADQLVRGIISFGLCEVGDKGRLRNRIALCALGGYGRGELSPGSDLDICLIYTGRLDRKLEALNAYLVPVFWDVGFKMGYMLQEVRAAITLTASDPEVLTSYLHARLIYGDPELFARLERGLVDVQRRQKKQIITFLRGRLDSGARLHSRHDLYDSEPDIKENVGGLRDYHAAMWIMRLERGTLTLEDLQQHGELEPEAWRQFHDWLDFLWRIRNELHFQNDSGDNRLLFARQRHVARALGYEGDTRQAIDHFMQDYYAAARSMRRLLQLVIGITDPESSIAAERIASSRARLEINNGELSIGGHDPRWFEENPPRLMEVMWECARQKAPLDHVSREAVKQNVHLVGPSFRENGLVRRFFVAMCSRPLQAGLALRQAAETGLLGAFIPEFQAIEGIVRYEDFHSYPVDEHTLRAVEALATIPQVEGAIGEFLQRTLDHMRDPHLLVIAILLHDLGKAGGEAHVDEGVRLARIICARIGLPADETDQIVFLVQHHMLMNHIAMNRDTDDWEIIGSFAGTVRTTNQLRALLLLSYADLSAVGPQVWTEWKGALLARLYLKAEQVLLGHVERVEAFWTLPKAQAMISAAPADRKDAVVEHLKRLGSRYFVAFSAEQVVEHLACIEEAGARGLAVRCLHNEAEGITEIVVCTRNAIGLFANIAGSFMSQLVDVQRAAVFTASDGLVVDSFTVMDATNRRPLTARQCAAFEAALRDVIEGRVTVADLVTKARNRLFALHQPRIPVPMRIAFDNDASRTDTVVDIETGDRTGLLYDIACAFARHNVDLLSSHIMTDARQVRDSFYVRLADAKLNDPAIQAAVRSELDQAIRPLAVSV